MRTIDLRSDTVTRPSAAMRRAMAEAVVGDDVFGEDPTVRALQEEVADLLGKEAALFVPSGTMGNQICVKVHTQPGDEIIVEQDAHVFNYETAGSAFHSGVQVHVVDGIRGVLPLERVARAIRPKAYYMPPTKLVCIENTHNRAGGTVYPLEHVKALREFANAHGLAVHLDGARLWNACVASGIAPREYARHVDSVSVCLSKGLGAPVGSVVAGSQGFIDEALRYRKLFGGGMRQVGILAAAGLFALHNNMDRLAEDHEKANVVADALMQVPGFALDRSSVQTNIVAANVEQTGKTTDEIVNLLEAKGVLLSTGAYGSIRAVTHLDVTMDDVRSAASTILETLR
jgi:threonine aldolase